MTTEPQSYTIAEVAADEKLLRSLAGEVLNPGPWKHFWVCESDPTCAYCLRCDEKESLQNRDANCPVIKTPSGSLPDIVRKLIKKCSGFKGALHTIINEYLCATGRHTWGHEERWQWFSVDATPAEQAACLLAVLLPEKVRVKGEGRVRYGWLARCL